MPWCRQRSPLPQTGRSLRFLEINWMHSTGGAHRLWGHPRIPTWCSVESRGSPSGYIPGMYISISQWVPAPRNRVLIGFQCCQSEDDARGAARSLAGCRCSKNVFGCCSELLKNPEFGIQLWDCHFMANFFFFPLFLSWIHLYWIKGKTWV